MYISAKLPEYKSLLWTAHSNNFNKKWQEFYNFGYTILPMYVSQLWIYPIKSCRGISIPQTALDTKGFAFDRRFMFVDAEGQMLTQRVHNKMALIECEILQHELKIRSAGFPQISILLQPKEGEKIKAQVWSDVCKALRVNAIADEWISDFLKLKASLVYMPSETKRVVDTRYNTTKATTSFTDGFPILLISQASLDDLNGRLSEPLPITRFRPNLVVSGFTPYQEDEISSFEIGGLAFEVKKPCARCVITTINQLTTQKGAEPLKTLAKYRTKNNHIYFGQNVIHLNHEGQIAVGDRMTLISNV